MGDWRGGFSGRKKVLRSEDLQEEEVWAMIKGGEGSNSSSKTIKKLARGPSSSSSATAAFRVPRATPSGAGQQEFTAAGQVTRHQSSGTVDIPYTSKILKKRSKKNMWGDAHTNDDHGKVEEAEIDDDDDDDDEMTPPHEYLAKRLAITRIASHSMCEGVGRTLKGRDLSKLRNAVLTKTGFIE